MKSWTFADVAAHWDSVAYDKSNAGIDSHLRRFTDSAPLFAIATNAQVLDIDCRTANGTIFFQKKYPTATFSCIAMAESFLHIAQEKLLAKGISARVSQLHNLPLSCADNHFDTVLCYESIEHVPDPHAFVAELARVLKPNGTIVLTTPNRLWEPVHWLSATFKLDHGEGPHRMLPRKELIKCIEGNSLHIQIERTFVLVPVGPKWLLNFGRWIETILPECIMRMIALRRTFICRKTGTHDIWYEKLQADILSASLDTGCGTSVGVSNGTLRYEEKNGELTIVRTDKPDPVPQASYDASPARFCDYPSLNQAIFGKLPGNWLCGVVDQSYVGHASEESVRRKGASGGVITAMLLHLLETKRITGAVCLRVGKEKPWQASPVIARTKEEILACAGSVYSATPTNIILGELEHETGPLAYIGLPDQVAAIRKLQRMNHPSVRAIKYVFGPYTGTQMSFEAIRSFLCSHGVTSEVEIVDLKYRAGEWPGHLQITLKNGRVLKAEKFHYNYLIPFFITSASLQIPDFTNELTDISVGDAWSPKYEERRGGYSVILARSDQGKKLLEEMRSQRLLTLENVSLDEALDMHGHMLDFKKRGSFIRNSWKKIRPDFGYRPAHFPTSRIAVEWCLRCIFGICKTSAARWTVEHLPLSIVGPVFNVLRKTWKSASKPTKRKGLREMEFLIKS